MKVRAQRYSPPEGSNMPQLPVELLNASAVVSRLIPELMKLYGLAEVSAQPVQVGIASVNNVSKRDMPGILPKPIQLMRSRAARLISDIMLLSGILNITLDPDESDLATLQKFWDALSATADTQAQIKLNVEEDPTGRSVLNGEP